MRAFVPRIDRIKAMVTCRVPKSPGHVHTDGRRTHTLHIQAMVHGYITCLVCLYSALRRNHKPRACGDLGIYSLHEQGNVHTDVPPDCAQTLNRVWVPRIQSP